MKCRAFFLLWAIVAALPSCGEGMIGDVDEVFPEDDMTASMFTSMVKKVHLGNFGFMGAKPQLNKSIEFDTSNYKGALGMKRPGVFTTVQHFSFPGFSWSKEYIINRFKLAEELAAKGADGLIFLLQEEIYRPSATPQVKRQSANGSAYSIKTSKGNYGTIPSMPGNEDAYFLALLKAWKKLSATLGKKAVIVGCSAECEASDVWDYLYTRAGVKFIAENFDMIYLYHYPSSASLAKGASCTNSYTNRKGTHDAASYIRFWRNQGFQGLVNYLLVTKFANGVGTTKKSVVRADFVNAVKAGANIISCYPYISGKDNDTLAVDRMLDIYRGYY